MQAKIWRVADEVDTATEGHALVRELISRYDFTPEQLASDTWNVRANEIRTVLGRVRIHANSMGNQESYDFLGEFMEDISQFGHEHLTHATPMDRATAVLSLINRPGWTVRVVATTFENGRLVETTVIQPETRFDSASDAWIRVGKLRDQMVSGHTAILVVASEDAPYLMSLRRTF